MLNNTKKYWTEAFSHDNFFRNVKNAMVARDCDGEILNMTTVVSPVESKVFIVAVNPCKYPARGPRV